MKLKKNRNEIHLISEKLFLGHKALEVKQNFLEKFQKPYPKKIILNLSETNEIDYFGTVFLIGLLETSKKYSIQMSIENVSQDLSAFFKLFSMSKEISIIKQEVK